MEEHDSNVENAEYDPAKNYDEAIMEQTKHIEKEIADSQPLVGAREDFAVLKEEYVSDKIYSDKVQDLKSRYCSMRRTRGDGNCFYRIFGYGYLEKLLEDTDLCKKLKDNVEKCQANMVALGFPQFTVEDFHDRFVEVIDKVEEKCSPSELLEIFNEQGYSDYLVVYLRLIVSGQLQKEADFYMNFLDGGKTVSEFCATEVEPMGRESDHIHIIAMATALDTAICVEYMDRGDSNTTTSHTFPEDAQPELFLLYRPGHYDLLYKN